jgi:heme-degrading monooxygenase HmoA
MLTTIGMHYEVKPGKEQEFVEGFVSTLEVMKGMPGHVESHLYEDVQNRGSYVIMSQWRSKGEFEAFIHSPEFAKAVAWGKAEILRARPRHKVYTHE